MLPTMSTNAPLNLEQVNAVMNDHKLIADYVEQFRKAFLPSSSKGIAGAVGALQSLLEKRLLEHFTTEERHLFPALLSANLGGNIAQQIAALRQDHGQLLRDAKELCAMLCQRPEVGAGAGQRMENMVNFLNRLEEHRVKEDMLFHSLLEAQNGTAPAPSQPTGP